jgi:FlaA1/EpsC-like NDP-sugar epimerase
VHPELRQVQLIPKHSEICTSGAEEQMDINVEIQEQLIREVVQTNLDMVILFYHQKTLMIMNGLIGELQ